MASDLNRLSEDNIKILSEAIKRIDEAVFVGNFALTKFPVGEHDLIRFFYINYLERFTHGLESINILLKQFNGRVENSIGLILRAGLLDYLTASYLSLLYSEAKSEIERKELEKRFQEIVTDQIRHTLKFLKQSLNQTDIRYRNGLENIWNEFSFLFTTTSVDYENPEKHLITEKYITMNQMLDKLSKHNWADYYKKGNGLYYYYGKYEHFGLLTHKYQRQGLDKDFDNIMVSLDFFIEGISLCFELLELNELKEKFENIKVEFRKL